MIWCTLIISILVISGCAGLSTYSALPNEPPRGVRVYPPKIYLLVDKDKKQSKVICLPDFKNAYDVKPWTFLAKHDFTIKMAGGNVTELTSNQDTSAALALIQKMAELVAAGAAGAAGAKGMGPGEVTLEEATYGFESGIYELTEAGFKKVTLAP
jgi:hypothetical protein